MAIEIRTDFPGGNGVMLEAEDASDPPVARFAAEPKNCPQAMWFHFRLTGLSGRPVRVVLANPEQTLGGSDWSGDRPVWRGGSPPWARLGPAVRLECAGGRVEWGWDVPPGGDEVEVAHCFPYQPADLQATLEQLGGAFQSTMIGLTYANRRLARVFSALPESDRPAVYLTARHHAGETPGSWVLDGLMRHVAAQPRLRDAIVWWAVPFVDLDDVVAGSYGKDPFPHDANRAYGPGGTRRPEASAIEPDVRRLKQGCSRLFFADLHAPGHGEQANYVPLRGWDNDSPINPIGEVFANRWQAAQPEDVRSPIAHVTPRPGGNNRYPGLSSSRWAGEILEVEAVSVEVSYQGNGTKHYEMADYRRLGTALAETIGEWLLAPPAVRSE